jgi:hypothetical protein
VKNIEEHIPLLINNTAYYYNISSRFVITSVSQLKLTERKQPRRCTATRCLHQLRHYQSRKIVWAYWDSGKAVDGLFKLLARRKNASLIYVTSGSEQLSLNARGDKRAVLSPCFSASSHTGHPPSCLNPIIVCSPFSHSLETKYYDGKRHCQDRRLMPLWKVVHSFVPFSPYRRVEKWKRTAGDKDASFCYLSHSWSNLLVSGLVPPLSRCSTTLHSPSWKKCHFLSVFCQKGSFILSLFIF